VNAVLLVIGGPLFLVAAILHMFVRFRLKPKSDEMDEVYVDFEDQHEGYARYQRWYRRTLWLACVALLLLFIGIMV